MDIVKSTITLTFGEQSENHRGMQKLGNGVAAVGFTIDDLEAIKQKFEELGYETMLERLEPYAENDAARPAAILIIKQGLNAVIAPYTEKDLFGEQCNLQWDKKAYMYGRVVNKKARHNLCYSDVSQEPDYEEKKGRVISYNDIPITSLLRKNLPKFFGHKAKDMQCEGNYYYDTSVCGVGYHGDEERKKVIAVRLGATIPLVYQWYFHCERVGHKRIFNIDGGDVYVMSEKATGNDAHFRNIYTLRHAAGCSKFTA
jgi:hypothetical protein